MGNRTADSRPLGLTYGRARVSNGVTSRLRVAGEVANEFQPAKKETMNKTTILCLLGALLLTSAVWSQEMSNGGAEKAVAALEMQWLQSQKTGNVDLLAPLLADKFVSTNGEGKVSGKKETLAEAKGTKWTSVEYGDMKVTVFGNTAIATGEFKGKGTDEKGKALDLHERWTDTWVKMAGGKWQCVASQGSAIKM